LPFSPAELILLDNSEQNLFTIHQECTALGKSSDVRAMLGNIRDKALLDGVFNETRPQVVLHAAAYKHVPIQELHPWAAVSTNVGGTMNLIELSGKYEVEKFVLVSTDKAVTPINVMGVTKRLAERMIQTVNDHTKTVFLAVRFGNVIGSSGSVIPTFQQQIKDGGPVTITHPDMTRYFMSCIGSVATYPPGWGYRGEGSDFPVGDG
jgi:FlaA1/EpsC-like NDP-sugar epimerase